MIRKILVAAVLIASSLSAHAAQSNEFTDAELAKDYSIAPRPVWTVTSMPAVVSRKKPEESRFTYVANEHEVSSDTEYWLRAVQIAEKSDLADYGLLDMYVSHNYQKLIIHNLEVVRKGQLIDLLKTDDYAVSMREVEEGELYYNNNTQYRVTVDDPKAGDQYRISYSLVGWNSIFGEVEFRRAVVPNFLELDQYELVVHTNEPQSYVHKWQNTDQYPIVEKHTNSYYHWQLSALPKVEFSPMQPEWYTPFASLVVSQYTDWSGVVNWGSELFRIPANQRDDVRNKAAELRARNPADKDYILAVLRFVQNEIDYFSMTIGASTHKPRPPDRTFAQGFGDCKDKTLLIMKMLELEGIESSPIFVNTNGVQQQDLVPMPGYFNHVIATVNYAGKQYWLDGTSSNQVGDLDNLPIPRFGYGLLVTDNNRSLVPVTRTVENYSSIEVTEDIVLGAPGEAVTLKRELVMTGSIASTFYALEEYFEDERFEENYTLQERLFEPSSRTTSFGITFKEDEGTIVVNESYEYENPWYISGGQYRLDFNSPWTRTVLPMVDDERLTPLTLGKGDFVILNRTITGDIGRVNASSNRLGTTTDQLQLTNQIQKTQNALTQRFVYQVKQGYIEAETAKQLKKQVENGFDFSMLRLTAPIAQVSRVGGVQ